MQRITRGSLQCTVRQQPTAATDSQGRVCSGGCTALGSIAARRANTPSIRSRTETPQKEGSVQERVEHLQRRGLRVKRFEAPHGGGVFRFANRRIQAWRVDRFSANEWSLFSIDLTGVFLPSSIGGANNQELRVLYWYTTPNCTRNQELRVLHWYTALPQMQVAPGEFSHSHLHSHICYRIVLYNWAPIGSL